MITVQEMMSPDPVTLSRYNTLHDARQMMEEKQFRHIPIVDEDSRLIGLVTQRNVLAHGVSSQQLASRDELTAIESGTLLADIMISDVVTVTAGVKINDAAHLVHKNKFGCLPVVDRDHRLLGIITDHDFVEITIELLDMMEQREPLEIEDDI